MALNCIFCKECVVKNDNSKGLPVSLPPYGVAHTYCVEQDLLQKRLFKGVHIAELSDRDFSELKEMVLAEDNARKGVSSDIDIF